MDLTMGPMIAGPLDFVTQTISGASWTYALILGIVALDSFLPIAPSETIVIAASALAVQGKLMIWLIVVAAAVGAVLGDNVSYLLGNKLGDWAAPKLFRGEKGQKGLDWAKRQIHDRPWVIVLARFLPGGRTATTFASGWLQLPWRRFMTYDVPGGVLWTVYTSMLGYVGGNVFQNSEWKAILLGVGLAALVGLGIEVVQLVQRRRRGGDEQRPDGERSEQPGVSQAATTSR